MISFEEFKQLAADTGLHLWKQEEAENDDEWFISYPLPMFTETPLLHSAIMSYVPNRIPTEMYIYDELRYDIDFVNLSHKDNKRYYSLISSKHSFGDDNHTYDELKTILLNMKKKLLKKQEKINLKEIEGDFK